jgi:hypothetical protein
MQRLERVATIENEVEAMCLTAELAERGVPHVMRSYYDSAYDGLFQYGGGWGHVESPGEYTAQIRRVLAELREKASHHGDPSAETDREVGEA